MTAPRAMDRRTLLAGCTLAAVTVSLSWWLMPIRNRQRATPPGYTPPAWWDGAPDEVRQYFLTWDQFFWQAELAAPAPALPPASGQPFNLAATLMAQTMSSSGNDELKARFAMLILRSRRAAYLPFMAAGLDTTNSSITTRRTIVMTLRAFYRRHGSPAFPVPTRQALAVHYPLETEPGIKRDLDGLLRSLKVPH